MDRNTEFVVLDQTDVETAAKVLKLREAETEFRTWLEEKLRSETDQQFVDWANCWMCGEETLPPEAYPFEHIICKLIQNENGIDALRVLGYDNSNESMPVQSLDLLNADLKRIETNLALSRRIWRER